MATLTEAQMTELQAVANGSTLDGRYQDLSRIYANSSHYISTHSDLLYLDDQTVRILLNREECTNRETGHCNADFTI